MAENIGNPKITLTLDKEQAERALTDLKSSGSDTAKSLEASLGVALDGTSKRIKKLADEITGGGATRKLQELEKAIAEAGGVGKLTATQFDNLASRINHLTAQGGTASPKLAQIGQSLQLVNAQGAQTTDVMKSLGAAMQSSLSSGATSAAGALGPLGSTLASLGPFGLAAAAAITALGGGLIALGKAAADAVAFGSRVSDLALKSGTAAAGLQQLGFAGSLVGVSMESASGGILKFQKALEDSPEKVAALGLNVNQLKAMDPAAAFTAFAQAIASIESPSERTAAAMSVLGKSAGELLPLLRSLGEGSAETAKALGAVLTDEMVGKLDEVDDAATTLQNTWDGLWRNIGAQIATSFNLADALKGVAEAIGFISSSIQKHGPDIEAFLTAGFGFRGAAAAATGGLTEQFAKLATQRFRGYDTEGTALQQADLAAAGGGVNVGRLKSGQRAHGSFLAQQLALTGGSGDKGIPLVDIDNMDDAIKGNSELNARVTQLREQRKRELELQKKQTAETKRQQAEQKRLAEAEEKRYNAAVDAYNKATFGTDVGPFPAETIDKLTTSPLGRNALRDFSSLTTINKDLASRMTGVEGSAEAMSKAFAKTGFETKAVKADTEDWAAALADVANAAQFLPPVFAQAAGAIATGVNAMKGFKSKGGVFSKENLAGNLTSGLELIGTAKGIFDSESPFGGALTGAGIGAQFGPQGAAIGAALGAALGVAGKLVQSEAEKIGKDVGRDFGVAISDELAKTIEKDVKAKGRMDATLKNLGAVISEGGGVAEFGVEKTVSKMHDLFSAMERGTLTAQEVGTVFDDVFGELLPLAIDKTTGRLQDNARELLRMAQTRGVQSKEIDSFIQAQGTSALQGLTTFMKSAEITSQGAATAIGTSIAAIFDDLIVSGASRAEALKAITPAVQELRAELTATGFEGGAAFAALDAQIALISDEKFGPMIEGIGGLGTAMINLHNMNLLTQADFTALSTQITETFNSMVAQGANAETAMSALQPTLQTIWELQQDYGLAVDESTQKLLTQAQAAGLVGEAHRSAEDRMAESMDRLVNIFELVAEKLGVTKEALEAIDGTNVNVNTHFTQSGTPPPGYPGGSAPGGGSEPEPLLYQGGSHGILNYGSGTLAMLHGQEGVFTAGQLNDIVKTAERTGAASARMSGPMSSLGAFDAEILASLDDQTRLLAQLPAVLGRTTRDAVVFGKVTLPR
jgi:hypothetical protein